MAKKPINMNIWYFKLRFFNLADFKGWNIKGKSKFKWPSMQRDGNVRFTMAPLNFNCGFSKSDTFELRKTTISSILLIR